MGARRKARESALEVLYQMDMQKQGLESLLSVLNDYWATQKPSFTPEIFEEIQVFTHMLVKGVLQHKDAIDLMITKHLEHWTLEGLVKIDKNIMRIALFEMLYMNDIPRTVSINEAIEVAKRYGSPESHQFVNGVLDRVYKSEKEVTHV